jgi:murein DD-endopeptidase MepM/ murein hydrolase activator NlpD
VVLAVLAARWSPSDAVGVGPDAIDAGTPLISTSSPLGDHVSPSIASAGALRYDSLEKILLSAESSPAQVSGDGQEAPQEAPVVEPSRAEPSTYIVQPGDTVIGIADSFGISVETVMWANDLWDPDSLQIEDELVILPVSGVLHRIGDGDNVNYLALVYDVAAEEIVEFNGLVDPDMLVVGDRLVVPNGTIPPGRGAGSSRGDRPAPVPVATGSFRWPAGGYISQYFGENGHSGLDIAAQWGAPIYAADTGVVVTALKLGTGYGWYLVIDHENGYRTLYSHMSEFYVDYGERVVKGEVIGLIGSTGLSTGPHLHFEIFQNGVRVNPLNFLP